MFLYYISTDCLLRNLIQKKEKEKKKFVCGSPNWLPILEARGQVAGLIVMKISVMLK